jgi:hypothetical protein
MLDWTNGNGTARYWALRLVKEAVSVGDEFVLTTTTTTTTTTSTATDTGTAAGGAGVAGVVATAAAAAAAAAAASARPGVYAQALTGASGTGPKRVVLVNTQYTTATVTIEGAGSISRDGGKDGGGVVSAPAPAPVSAACYALVVDVASSESPPKKVACDDHGAVVIGPYASAVVYL